MWDVYFTLLQAYFIGTLIDVSIKIIPWLVVWDTFGTWHAMYFTENKNGKSKLTYSSRYVAFAVKKPVFAGIFISPLPQRIWTPDLAGWWHRMRCSHPKTHMTLWSCGLMRSSDKLRTLQHSTLKGTPRSLISSFFKHITYGCLSCF